MSETIAEPRLDTVLEMQHITKEFPGVRALDDVTLHVERGEIHAICGENGAGKSTLMKVLSGVHPHGTYEGEILLEGEPVRFNSIKDSEKKGIVIIHQELALSPYLSIAENIFLGNEIRRGPFINWDETRERAIELLGRVELNENPMTPVNQIGVGKQQLVEIAKAMSKDAKLLILDEPTAELNDSDSEHLLNLLRRLRQRGITCIIISHKLGEIESIADTVTIIRDGTTVDWFSMQEPDANQSRMIRSMVGRPLDKRYPDHTPNVGEEIFRVEDWTVRHPTQSDRIVVKKANLSVHRGEIVGIAGLMGSGRTELCRSIFGHSWGHRLGGTAYLNGGEVDLSSVGRALDAGIAYASEDRKVFGLNLIQDIRINISSAAMKKVAPKGFINVNEELHVAEQYRRDMRIKTPSVLNTVGSLSGGNQQKVALSKWLYTDPQVLILDEPTRGIDVGAKFEIYTIINKLAEQGRGVLVISSELPELLGICDRIYTLSAGRITGCLDADTATQESLMHLMTLEEED
nr:sugar ABC transporter ATP-binding protein [Actinomycetales bacterium]